MVGDFLRRVPAAARRGGVFEVVAEQRIGTLFPVGGAEVEAFRADMPWGRTPPPIRRGSALELDRRRR
jgi:hypothetical protein